MLYGRGQAISWQSYSKMGVSCLQLHISHRAPSTDTESVRKAHTPNLRHIQTVEAAILFIFSLIHRHFYHWIPHVREKQPVNHNQLISRENTQT